MILRRFMQHVKEQSWFAVGLDVIVVIVGIFLGLQVQAWYEDQAVREQELTYLNQLHEEVVEITEIAEFRYDRATKKMEVLQFITHYFSENTTPPELSDNHCVAIVNSHIRNSPSLSLSTLTEIINSGQINIIQNKNIRSLITNYIRENERSMRVEASSEGNTKRMGSIYPDMIKVGPFIDIDESTSYGRTHQCNFTMMNESQAFQNDLLANASLLNVLRRLFPRQIPILNELHDQIDRSLGLTH
ncbi:MAG: hypothetical protein HOH19_09380 [Kordiimonadaceae bacterium]|jgi:hypothetical protein|nr:hypothetical protein [Kordiimonadaceae bacterium]MBT6032774.1 hypothetical protein [Kordiimonadaceae bacterium]